MEGLVICSVIFVATFSLSAHRQKKSVWEREREEEKRKKAKVKDVAQNRWTLELASHRIDGERKLLIRLNRREDLLCCLIRPLSLLLYLSFVQRKPKKTVNSWQNSSRASAHWKASAKASTRPSKHSCVRSFIHSYSYSYSHSHSFPYAVAYSISPSSISLSAVKVQAKQNICLTTQHKQQQQQDKQSATLRVMQNRTNTRKGR